MGLRHFLYGNKKQKSKKKQIKNKLGMDSDSSSKVAQSSGNHEGGHKKIITDSRFSFVHSDPRFQNVPKHRAKVPIDSRFDRMFVDKNFSSSATLDKRGKPKVEKSKNSLRHYYRIEDENEKERDQEESENDEEEIEGITTGDKEEDEELKDESRSLSLAGDGSSSELDTSESEEDAASRESEYEVDTDEDELDDVAYEEDVPVETVPEIEKETHRLAVVNMDWRYIKAEHLYMMLSSFLPKGGQILCVSVYPSEFGLQRMKEEEVHGPVGLFDDEEEQSEEEDGGEIDDEKLRAYELSRLRYYYAVVECDSVATADYLYKSCDGVEFERSSNVLDLRFIPDSMEFKHPPRDIATQAPGNYEAIDFHTSALQKSNIDLSWEEDEPHRVKKLKRKYDIDKDEQDFKEFLASEDSDTDLENEDQSGEKQTIEHYRALMQSGSGSDEDDERGGLDMEVTFNSGLEDLSKRILEKKEKKSETVWESILRKKREKKKAKKNKSAYSSEDDSEFSDQEAVEADDFFIEEPVAKRSKKEKEREVQTTDKEAEASIAELELLLADGQDTKPGIKGFNLKPKKIKERKGNKVRKAMKVLDEEKIPTVDFNDPRFSALFVSPLYALDPTDPQFKRSAAYARQMALKQQNGDSQELLESQQRNLSSPTNKDDDTQKSELLKSKKEKYELSSLVRSIKMKSKQGHAPTEVTSTKTVERDHRLRSVDEEAKERDSPPDRNSLKKKHRHLQKNFKVK